MGGESVRKLAGTTKLFWEAGWDALSVAAEVVDLYDTLGRRFPTYRPGNPAAWLGWALRQVDHRLTPAVFQQIMEALRHELELNLIKMDVGSPYEGQPGGGGRGG